MALRILRFINHWFSLAAFWGYLAAVALAFTMVIVFFPVGALALLFAGLLLLPVVVGISTGMGSWERAWCRRWLRAARCPSCLATESVGPLRDAPGALGGAHFGVEASTGPAPGDEWLNSGEPARYACRRCGACFAESGCAVESPFAA